MFSRPLIVVFILGLLPSPAAAEGMIVTLPEHCDADENTVMDNGGYVLHSSDIEGIEYICEFDALPARFWEDDDVDIRPGYCASGIEFTPQVFAFTEGHQMPGEIRVIGAGGLREMKIFYVCDLQPSK